MARIPYGPTRTVADNLVDTTRCQLNRYGRHPVDLIARSPRTITDVRVMLDDLGRFLGGDLDLRHDDLRFFGSKVWQIVTSCRERRNEEYEKIGWWEFIGAEAALACLPEAARTRHHPLAGRGQGAHREHQDDRRHLRPAAVRHRHAGAEHRPRAERPDERRLDRSVAPLPRIAGGRLSQRLQGGGGRRSTASASARPPSSAAARARPSTATISSSRCRSRT